jgi:hypothetical protein
MFLQGWAARVAFPVVEPRIVRYRGPNGNGWGTDCSGHRGF